MAPIDDKLLDQLLTRHVSSRLEGHIGRSEIAFRRRLVDDPSFSAPLPAAGSMEAMRIGPGAGGHSTRSAWWRQWGRGGALLVTVAGTALAASLATLWVLPQLSAPAAPAGGGSEAQTQPISTPHLAGSDAHPGNRPMVRYVQNRVWDEGTVTPQNGDAPMRRVRYQQLEHMRWYDPARGAEVEVDVPREDVHLYQMDTY